MTVRQVAQKTLLFFTGHLTGKVLASVSDRYALFPMTKFSATLRQGVSLWPFDQEKRRTIFNSFSATPSFFCRHNAQKLLGISWIIFSHMENGCHVGTISQLCKCRSNMHYKNWGECNFWPWLFSHICSWHEQMLASTTSNKKYTLCPPSCISELFFPTRQSLRWRMPQMKQPLIRKYH